MSRRMMAAPAALALSLAACMILAGCASPSTGTTPTSGPSSSATAKASTPKPKPTPTFVAKDYDCHDILPPATLAVFESRAKAGFTLQKDYVERVRNFSPDLSQFADWGGILCQWAYPNTESSVDYGFSAITADEVTTEQAMLTKNGYTGVAKDNGQVYENADTKDYPDVYLFLNGYWFYASSDAVLQLIVDNVFTTDQ